MFLELYHSLKEYEAYHNWTLFENVSCLAVYGVIISESETQSKHTSLKVGRQVRNPYLYTCFRVNDQAGVEAKAST